MVIRSAALLTAPVDSLQELLEGSALTALNNDLASAAAV
jgi:hypothetical protein